MMLFAIRSCLHNIRQCPSPSLAKPSMRHPAAKADWYSATDSTSAEGCALSSKGPTLPLRRCWVRTSFGRRVIVTGKPTSGGPWATSYTHAP